MSTLALFITVPARPKIIVTHRHVEAIDNLGCVNDTSLYVLVKTPGHSHA